MSAALGEFALLRPLWLAAVPVLLLVVFLVLRRVRGLAGWSRAFDPALLQAMERMGRVVPGRAGRAILPVVAALFLALALSGPARRIADPDTFRNLDGLVLAMDLSRSVAEGGSLDDAQAAAQLMLQEAGGRSVALLVYAGETYVASAFTTDALALGSTLAVLDGETVPDPGSRTDRALTVAGELLREAGVLGGDVVLVTDGDNVSPEAMATARELAAENFRVSGLFVEPTELHGDMPAPDPAALAALASAGQGFFAPAHRSADVTGAIRRRAAAALAEGETAVLLYRDYGRFLLVFALLPVLLLFRRVV